MMNNENGGEIISVFTIQKAPVCKATASGVEFASKHRGAVTEGD
jgi:hypothetical protein